MTRHDFESSVREWAEHERDWRLGGIGEGEYLRWKASYDPVGRTDGSSAGAPTAAPIGRGGA